MLADGEIIEAKVDGMKAIQYALADDAKMITDLSAGRIPKAWKPVNTTTTEEVFCAAGSCQRVDGQKLYSVLIMCGKYKPEHQRKYGYYVLPVLWGDRLAAPL